ncbi:MAG: hypothetical protein ACK5KS_07735 [Planctomyces sp.]
MGTATQGTDGLLSLIISATSGIFCGIGLDGSAGASPAQGAMGERSVVADG